MSQIDEDLRALCAVLEAKVSRSNEALEYVAVGEYGLALEMLSDWRIQRLNASDRVCRSG